MTQNPTYPPQPPGMPGYGNPMPPQQQSNGFAIAGLIFGIIGFCVPFLGGLIGLILGFIGLSKTKNPAVSGRGMSITAIILSIVSLITSGIVVLGFSASIYALVRGTAAPRAAARTFVQDLSSGNMTAARADADPSITDAELDAMSTQLKAKGTFVDMTALGFSAEATPGHKTCAVGGALKFSGGPESFNIELVDTANGWKVTKADFH